MSLIKPFNGIRPQKEFVKKVSFPNINYFNNYKQNKKLNFLNILNNRSISEAKRMLLKLEGKKIIKEDNSIYHNVNDLEKKINNNGYIIEYLSIDNYIDKKMDDKKKKQKIKLKE